jgi:hypothetical protein
MAVNLRDAENCHYAIEHRIVAEFEITMII